MPIGEAHELYQRGLRGFRAAGDPVGEAHVLWRLADVALERGQLGPGLAFAQYNTAEMSWTLEDNESINGPMQLLGGRLYKKYRIFEMAI